MKKTVMLLGLCMCAWLFCGNVATASSKSTTITISAAGDCTLSSDVKNASGDFFRVYNQKKDPSYFFRKVKKVFSKDDLTIVNFEGTLSKRGTRVDKKWAFRGNPKYVKILNHGSVEMVSLANNHVYDYGTVAYNDTKKTLQKAGIKYATAYTACTKMVKGVKVGYVAISSIESNYSATAKLKAAMKMVKRQKPQVIIVSMHAGTEYTQDINGDQKALSRLAIQQGADVVIGHHPHIMQGIEKYKGAYILYSLGNFCFGGNTNPPDKDCYIAQIKFTVQNKKLVRKSNPKVIPCKISSASGYNNYQPMVCDGTAKKKIISRLNSFSKKFGVKIAKDGVVK
jgi:poly-gamma-glutamate synthesis protein (capsule biosynthesis protein)